MLTDISNKIRHFFHVVSNVRPIVWIGLYVALTPVFALIYMWLPDGQFRIPDGGATDYGSWLYYSIVTITTLGFGDYTPCGGLAQCVTAVEVMCGLIILGFFLNAVGAMKSEIDVESELEKQKRVHAAQEKDKLDKSTPALLRALNNFLAECYMITTPESRRTDAGEFNPDFGIKDLSDMLTASESSESGAVVSSVKKFFSSARRTSLALDSLQSRVDLTLWPDLLEECFAFVANCQVYDSEDMLSIIGKSATPDMPEVIDLYHFIKENGVLAQKIETTLTELHAQSAPDAE